MPTAHEHRRLRARKSLAEARKAVGYSKDVEPRQVLKRLLKKANMTMQELADDMGVHETTAYRWGGKLDIPAYAINYLMVVGALRRARTKLKRLGKLPDESPTEFIRRPSSA